MTETQRVVVGLSGGVDSAVAALLLLERGYRVEGLFMKNWEEDDTDQYCSAAEDLRDAEAVCERLGIGLRTVNFASEYWDQVFARFLDEHRRGLTPNPDVLCNRELKFSVFLDYALAQGAQRLATGHYAGITYRDGRHRLMRGTDRDKDQTYFLCTLGQAQLARALFPLAGLCKREVRALARKAGLVTHDKKDSTGICFIGERPFREFLKRYIAPQPGNMETPDGRVVGRHEGLMYYTLGQRQGLGLGGRSDGTGEPWYVAAKELARNVLVVVQGRAHPLLYSTWLRAGELNWIAEEAPSSPLRCTARTRYRQADQPCEVEVLADGGCEVRFQDPQWAVTPGQSVVLYDGEECLGGGVIRESGQSGTGVSHGRTPARMSPALCGEQP